MGERGTESFPVGRARGSPPAAPKRVEVGMRLGRYEITAALARGGMAEVWVAQQRGELGFRRPVALKTIRPEHAGDVLFKKSFLEEARVASQLRHAHVVEVLDLGEEGEILYLAMPLVDGPSLRQLQDQRKQLPVEIALRVISDALLGLHAAHELGDDQGTPMELVHRDVSPQNILIGKDGIAKLTDFGVAKALGRLVDETEVGQLRGKIGYLAPEQVRRSPIDRRTDLFAMGVCLWEMLTHCRLHRGADLIAALAEIAQNPAPNVQAFRPEVPLPLAEVTSKALALLPEDRYATALEFQAALDAAAKKAGLRLAPHREVAEYLAAESNSLSLVSDPSLPIAVAEDWGARRAVRWIGAALLLLALGAASAYGWARRGEGETEVTPLATEPGSGAAPAPSFAGSGAPEQAPAAAPELAPAPMPAAALDPPAPPPARPATERPRVNGARSKPKPKFSNPYAP